MLHDALKKKNYMKQGKGYEVGVDRMKQGWP